MSGAAAATAPSAAALQRPLPAAPERAPGGAQRLALAGGRWHLQHGPIDIVLQAEGEPAAVAAAHQAAWQAFDGVLAALVAELPLLRQPVRAGTANPLQGEVARAMWAACAPFAAQGFITPMAAVAGAVAQHLIQHYPRPGIQRAWVNNGGDIALHLAPGAKATVGVFADLARLDGGQLARTSGGQALPLDGRFAVHAGQPVRGVATSGWRGRSFSLGIADSVTVLAATAAQADAAATVVANAVNLDHAAIVRRPACQLRDDSDLGDRLVTVQVPPLPAAAVQQALAQGAQVARALQRQGRLWAVALQCQGHTAVVAPPAAPESPPPLVQ
jgi:ApbE superfamily uncharacterized protein (UPF0280 family)